MSIFLSCYNLNGDSMTKIGIYDDNAEYLKLLTDKTRDYFVSKNEIPNICCFFDAKSLLKNIEKNEFDLLLLDIELNGSEDNGIELAKKINYHHPNCFIIFVSSHTEFFIDVYDANHIYFVIKNDLDTGLNKALSIFTSKKNQSLFGDSLMIKFKNQSTLVPFSKIVYLESLLRKIRFHLADKDLYSYASFDEILLKLNSENFVQCHRSFIVNLRHIDKIIKNEIFMIDGSIVPIGRMFRKQFLEDLFTKANISID